MLPLPQVAELSDVPTDFHTTDFAGVFPQMGVQQLRCAAQRRHAPTPAVVPYGAGRLEAFERTMNDEGFVLDLARLV